MLKRLLNSVSALGSNVSAAMAAASAPAAADPGPYVELLDPIEGATSAAGVDLAYEDEYAAIQDQVAKRGDVDDSVIQGNAILLLRTRGKDLRPAVFLAYSTLRVDGLATCMQALALVRALIDQFGADLHPRKPAARRAALEWLCNERFIDPLTLQVKTGVSEVQLQQLQATARALAESTQAWPEEARPDLSGLLQRVEHWLNDQATNELRQAVSGNAQAEHELPPLRHAGPGSDAAATPKSAQEAWLLIRKASVPLRADAQWADAGRAVLRAARWASVAEMPPHSGGTTRFAAPRKESRAYLANLHGTAQWAALLEECTRVFNEASNHHWLDLQYWSDASHMHLGSTAHEISRTQLALDLRSLLNRLPLLPTLKFEDSTAMASPATQEWISNNPLLKPASLHKANGSDAAFTKANGSGSPHSLDVLASKARKAMKAQGLGAALSLLQSAAQSCEAQQQRFEVQGLMLTLARDAGRRDLALGLARDRAAQIDTFALHRWSPELAFDVWADLYALLRNSGEAMQAEARALYGQLCGLDAARAADLQ